MLCFCASDFYSSVGFSIQFTVIGLKISQEFSELQNYRKFLLNFIFAVLANFTAQKMASSSSSLSPSNSQSEPAIIEQVITEFFAKSLHIILEARSPFVSSRNYNSAELAAGGGGSSASSSNSSSPSGVRPRDKWFNLALRECPAALENFDLWRQSFLDPLVIDIILTSYTTTASPPKHQRRFPGGAAILRTLSNKERQPSDTKSEKIVERWVIQYESQGKRTYPITRSGTGLHSFEVPSLYKKIYKCIIVLLRSLYVTVRLLPAYRLFRDLNAFVQLRAFNLSHRISYFVEPFTRRFEADMSKFTFSSVDTPCGRLSLAVSYLTSIGDINCEPSTPLSTHFIPDYVGSPTTDPLRKFQSLPMNYISFERCHSWSNDHRTTTTRSPIASPTYSDSHASRFTQITSLPPNYPSPPFSSSPLLSANLAAGHLSSELLRTESAPVGIPIPRAGRNIGLNAGLPPSPSPKGDNQQVKKDFHSGMGLQKVIPMRKEDVRSLAGLKISSGSSPRITSSRSLSRLSFLDEYDDLELACPFADHDDASDMNHRVEPIDGKGHTKNLDAGGHIAVRKSQEAEVGTLVKILKTAAPLRQVPSVPVRLSQAPEEECSNTRIEPSKAVEIGNLHCAASDVDMSTSGLIKLRTAADALEELRSYCKMKEQLLKQGELSSLNEHQEPGFAEKGSSGF